MNRVLIVANQTLGGAELQREIRDRADADPCDFWVLVPATNPVHLELAPDGYGGFRNLGGALDDRGPALAETRLQAELGRLRGSGIRAAGEVGHHDPMRAIRDTLRKREVDEIIVATLPPGISRWLRLDLVHRLQRTFHLPVTHVLSRERAPSTRR